MIDTTPDSLKARKFFLSFRMLVCGSVFGPLFCNAVLRVLSSLAIISLRKRELAALLKLCSCYQVVVSVLCFFTTVEWAGLQCVIVTFPGHPHLLFLRAVLKFHAQSSQGLSMMEMRIKNIQTMGQIFPLFLCE